MKIVEQYIEDVMTGKVLACNYVKLAVERHLNDLMEGIDRGLSFNRKDAARAVNFYGFLNHTTGEHAGKKFELEPWQAFINWCIYGWKAADGTRRYNYAYIEVARKNGKSAFSAGNALYLFVADREMEAQIYTAATKYQQAKIVFSQARNMVMKSPYLKDKIGIYQHNMHIEPTLSKFEPLSSDHHTLDGLNPSGVIIDEFHEHKTDDLINVLSSGMGARKQPLMIIITTAGFNQFGPCYATRKMVIDILTGIKKQDNYFGIIYTLDENDKWDDPVNWVKANPNLGVSVQPKFLHAECTKAKNNPRLLVNFLTKNLNVWTNAASVWIKDEDWMRCNKGGSVEALAGMQCYGGLDLASHMDLNAFALFFPEVEALLLFFWMPEDSLSRKDTTVDWAGWVREGYIKLTPGNVTDIDFMLSDITAIVNSFDVKSIAFDPARAFHGIIQGLMKEDIKMSEFRQGFISMDAPTKELEKMIVGCKINHFGNPVLRWMNSNVAIKTDPAGNIKIDKAKSINKVDGMVASVMAIGEYMTITSTGPADINDIYANRGINFI